MNDETENDPGTVGEPAPQESQGETAPADDWTVTEGTDPTEEVETISIQVIESVGSDIIHADLFGSFLICGTLIGIAIWRKFDGA
jgi:hypothetical protein